MPVKKLPPIPFVEKIEPVLPFWTQCARRQAGIRYSPAGKRGTDVPVVYQPGKEHAGDFGRCAERPSFLYLEVDDLNVIKAAVTDAEVYMPEGTTFYGSREIGVKDPSGHFIMFAHFAAPAPA